MGLQTEGIVFMAIAWSCVISLLIYCYARIIKSEKNRGKEKAG